MKKTITFFKSLLLIMLLFTSSNIIWGQVSVNSILYNETFGNNGSSATSFTASTMSSYDKRGTTTLVSTDKSLLSFSGANAMYSTTSATNMTSGHVWLNKSTTGYIQISGIPIYNASKIKVSFSQAGSGSIDVYANFGSGETKVGTSSSASTLFETSAFTTSGTTLILKLQRQSNTTNLRLDNITVTVTEVTQTCTTPTFTFSSTSVSKLTTDVAFTNAFTSNNTSTKVWSSTNEAVATVDSNGEVTIIGAGSTNIRVNQAADATYCAVVDASYALNVTAPGVAEPTNQPTELSATTNSTSQITVTWTDATGTQLPEHYLVKASTGTITAPVDAAAEADAALVQNIAQGTQTAVFTGLNASTTYNFSIWPYTNSGAAIDYKTDGTIATASATTETPLGIPVATAATDVTPTGFTSNWGAAAAATGYELDVYQGGDILSEDFASISIGNNTSTSGSSSAWTGGNTNFPTVSTAYQAGGAVKIGASSAIGSITTKELNLSSGAILTFDVKGWTTVEGSIAVTVNGANAQTVTYTATMSDAFETKTLSIAPSTSASTITIATSAKRAFIDNVVVAIKTSVSGSPFTVTETSKAVSGLNPDTQYFYTVVAKNATGSSVASNKISVTTPKITFTGTGEWTETARWNTGAVPGTTAQVVVDGDAIINSNVEIAGLTINAGKSLTVNAAKQLTISGTATNNGTITIQSDASGTGTIVGNVSGAATVNQHLSSYRTWYLSSPVSNVTPSNMDRYKFYDETTGNWSTTAPAQTIGAGFLAVPTNNTVTSTSFTGTLNSGNVSIDVTRTVANGSKPGFNLVGNPYPSYLDWSEVNTANSSLMPTSTMWYRTKKRNQSDELVYQFWTVNGNGVGSPGAASQYIPPMQAFWVRAKASGQFQLTNDMRSHAVGEDYLLKAPAANRRTLIRLELSNGTNTDETVLYLSDNANNELDAFDAPKMSNEDVSIAEIFTRAGNEKLVINALQTLPKDTEIALGFEAGSGTSFTLRANELSNLPTDVKLILKDNVTKAETDLTDGTAVYSFGDIATSGDRFSIIFRTAGAITGIDQPTFSGLTAYSNANNQLTVLYDGAIDAHTVVSVYNAVGQRLVTQSLKGVSTVIDGEFTPGVYVVKVNNLSRKLTIKN